MCRRRVRLSACLLVVGVLVGCQQTPPPSAVAYVEIKPSAALFTQVGDQRSFTAVAYDAQGRPIDVPIAWQVADVGLLELDANGVATARSALGSTQVTAMADGIASPPALAWMAAPVAGATLIDDDQIIGAIEPVDPVDDFDIGWHYRVALAGVPLLSPGTVLLGTGEAPLAGSVVSATPDGDNVSVVLEIVPLDELLDSFAIAETFDLERSRVRWDEELLEGFEVVQQTDGSYDLVPRVGGPSLTPQQAENEFKLGPLTCKTTLTASPLQLNGIANVKIKPDFDFQIVVDSEEGLKLLALTGSLEAAIKLEPKIETAFEGKLDCTFEFGVVTIPMGPLGLLLSGQVPIGGGFELNGDVTGATVGVVIEAAAKVQATVGLDCTTGPCETLAVLDATASGGVAPKIEGPDETLKLDVRVHGFGFAKLAIGNPLFKKLRFDAFDLRGGPALLIDLAPMKVQAGDPDYRSDVRAVMLGIAKASSKFDVFLKLLKVSAAKVEIKVEVPLAQMPTGTLTITPNVVTAGDETGLGDMATFRVDLTSTTFLGVQAVDGIEIFWLRDGSNPEPGRPPCTTLSAASGQTTFTCEADFLTDHKGDQTFVAFAHVRLLGVPLAVPLEIAADSSATVKVESSTCEEPTPPPPGAVGVFVSIQGDDASGAGSLEKPFRTITHALATAPDGDTIHVLCGTYTEEGGETFPLEVGGRELAGVGADEVRIAYFGEEAGVVGLLVEGGATVRGVTLVGFSHHRIDLQSGTLIFEDAGIRGGTSDGSSIEVRGGAELRFTRSYINDTSSEGINGWSGASVHVEDSTIIGVGADGIDVDGGASLFVRRSKIINNGSSGVEFGGSGTIDLGTADDPGGNTISGNGEWQIQDRRSDFQGATVMAHGNDWGTPLSGVVTGPGSLSGVWEIRGRGNKIDFGP